MQMRRDANEQVEGLLGAALGRAVSNLSSGLQNREAASASVENLMGAAIQRADYTMEKRPQTDVSPSRDRSPSPEQWSKTKHSATPGMLYRGNPAITNTALAHSLWSALLRPGVDTAIDATCGNGHDSVALANILFPNSQDDNEGLRLDTMSRLVCMDVQKQACISTEQALSKDFSELLDSKRIRVLQASHSPLPTSWGVDGASNDEDPLLSVALVVYNLGWLPNNVDGTKEYITQTSTTLQSMVDAMLLLRVGGMISVVTYPKTNFEEDAAVRAFLECSALLSSNIQTWQNFLTDLDYSLLTPEALKTVTSSMERLVGDGDELQTWRVSEHRKLGMDRAPILLTATRIK